MKEKNTEELGTETVSGEGLSLCTPFSRFCEIHRLCALPAPRRDHDSRLGRHLWLPVGTHELIRRWANSLRRSGWWLLLSALWWNISQAKYRKRWFGAVLCTYSYSPTSTDWCGQRLCQSRQDATSLSIHFFWQIWLQYILVSCYRHFLGWWPFDLLFSS